MRQRLRAGPLGRALSEGRAAARRESSRDISHVMLRFGCLGFSPEEACCCTLSKLAREAV